MMSQELPFFSQVGSNLKFKFQMLMQFSPEGTMLSFWLAPVTSNDTDFGLIFCKQTPVAKVGGKYELKLTHTQITKQVLANNFQKTHRQRFMPAYKYRKNRIFMT